jgi:SAM-dependent methyltransferase
MESALSFRDPEGCCLRHEDRILRFVYRQAADRVRTFAASDFARSLLTEKKLPATRLLPSSEADALLQSPHFSNLAPEARDGLVLEHELIPFPSYPYEWSPAMLFAAGELTLDLQLQALDAGYTLKDATPLNILFRDAQPVFVDFLSFDRYKPGAVIWTAYSQFVCTFLLPLLLYRNQGTPINELFLGRRDGIEPAEVYHRLNLVAKLWPLALQFVTFPTWFGRFKFAESVPLENSKSKNPPRELQVARGMIVQLRGAFRRLRPQARNRSHWIGYMDDLSYADDSFVAKRTFVCDALRDLSPRTVLDIGCNTGYFSCLCAAQGASVVALDSDSAVIDQVWQRSRKEGLSVLPLVMDFGRPSPGMGWRNSEKTSFLQRAKGNFDAALLLAVIHHLTVTHGIPLYQIFELLSEMVTNGLVVEYVPPEDPMFQKISRNKEHLIPRLGQAEFEASYASWFTLVRRTQLPNSSRWMYLLRRGSPAMATLANGVAEIGSSQFVESEHAV